MLEKSLHILDIVNNSVKANASLISVTVNEAKKENLLKISIEDNGCGMDKDFLAQVLDPFRTTRTTRKVGMGLSLFKAAAENTGGNLCIESEKNVGTKVYVQFVYDHIDRQPLGDMGETMLTLISGNTSIDFVYTHTVDDKIFMLDTREMKSILGEEVSLGSPDVVLWLSEYIKEGLEEISS